VAIQPHPHLAPTPLTADLIKASRHNPLLCIYKETILLALRLRDVHSGLYDTTDDGIWTHGC